MKESSRKKDRNADKNDRMSSPFTHEKSHENFEDGAQGDYDDEG